VTPLPSPAFGRVVLVPLAAPVAGGRLRAEAALWNALGWALFSATCWLLRQALGR
jgi:hypothetical protein